MARVFSNSAFGVLVRLVSGGRLFTPREYRRDFTLPPPYQLAARNALARPQSPEKTAQEADGRTLFHQALPRDEPGKDVEGIQDDTLPTPAPTPPESSSLQSPAAAWIEPEVLADGTILVDWYSADDPDNPHNWSFAAKLLVYVEVNLFTFLVFMAAAIVAADEGQIQDLFGVSRTVSSLGLALYVLGYGMGPMIWSPMSEVPSVGRNPPYVISVTIFLILAVPTALVNNVPGFLVLRYLQGFFGSPGLATGGASLADVTAIKNLPYGLYIWGMCSIAGPAIAPTISGFSVPVKGWHWAMWEILWAAALCFVSLLFLPETSGPAILHLRAKRLRQLTGTPAFRSRSEIQTQHATALQIAYEALVIPWKVNALDPAVLFTTVYIGLVYAIFYSYFEVLPLVYQDIYHMNLGQLGLIFLSCVVSSLLLIPFYYAFVHFSLNKAFRRGAFPHPEHRLVPAIVGSVLIPAGLFLFAWTSRASIHWIVPTIGLVIEVAGMSLVLQCIFSYLSVAYMTYSASLFAMNDLARASLAFAAILWSGPLYDRLGVARGTTLLAGLTVGCIVGVLVLYWFGPSLRRRSRFAG
ncbi:hypothetical protein ASPCADRAFT_4244 [Aspergillus carbonarius ITEM 5010]|uniref:Major facilitator superfamily (MFS) profile domain-containing protein n=1 Tax=Aspergillus carbonarius (strain ITEM 5010) TaxID=602072 RepID=A0A1R3RT15_ASPC5|nr:hypothetical protein ASPCADRAFT_4244 [Aspergillus carbonarius ITEM 5010]